MDAVLRFEGAGESPLIGWGVTCGPSAATLLNSTFIQGFELDDFHPLAPLHSASLVIPALLAAASACPGADGASFLTAAIAGFEVGPRVGLALHGSEMLSVAGIPARSSVPIRLRLPWVVWSAWMPWPWRTPWAWPPPSREV